MMFCVCSETETDADGSELMSFIIISNEPDCLNALIREITRFQFWSVIGSTPL